MGLRGRVLGIDVGRRRIGLAISDWSRTLARPLTTLTLSPGDDAVARVALEIARLAEEEDGLASVVVGLPRRLDGTPTELTPYVNGFMQGLRDRTGLPIAGEDERLTSHEAEQRLAVQHRDWRQRKRRLDGAAAAILLQDHLDRSP